MQYQHRTIVINEKARQKYDSKSGKVFFKVVRINGKNLQSAVAYGQAKVVYRLKKWVSPPSWLEEKGYGLTVFADFETALDFAKGMFSRYAIYACKVDGIFESLPLYAEIVELANGRLAYVPRKWWNGTIMVKKVKLLQKIADVF